MYEVTAMIRTRTFLAVVVMVVGVQMALCAPVIKGIALCVQPLPGESSAGYGLGNLALVTLPGRKPVLLFPTVPADLPPTNGVRDAWLLDGGRLVLIHARHASDDKAGYLLLANPTRSKHSIIAGAVDTDSIVLVSPNKKAVFYYDKAQGLVVWHTDGSKIAVQPPKGWKSGYCEDWSPRMPHLRLTYWRIGSETSRDFWLDERTGALKPIAPADPWLKALDMCKGKSLIVDDHNCLWLKAPGRRKIELAHLEAGEMTSPGGWCRFSPDGRYVICTAEGFGLPDGGSTYKTYCFDLRRRRPVQLKASGQSFYYITSDEFIDWYSKEGGILHKCFDELRWTDFPSLKTSKVATLPDKCEFVDFIRTP